MLKTSHFNITTYFRSQFLTNLHPEFLSNPSLEGTSLLSSPLGEDKLRIVNLYIKAKAVNLPLSKGVRWDFCKSYAFAV